MAFQAMKSLALSEVEGIWRESDMHLADFAPGQQRIEQSRSLGDNW
jgi:hypothetical protein